MIFLHGGMQKDQLSRLMKQKFTLHRGGNRNIPLTSDHKTLIKQTVKNVTALLRCQKGFNTVCTENFGFEKVSLMDFAEVAISIIVFVP